jgi:hypothetical protein
MKTVNSKKLEKAEAKIKAKQDKRILKENTTGPQTKRFESYCNNLLFHYRSQYILTH